MPAGAMPYLAWDMRPVRPWEWWQIIAADWAEANAVRAAYSDGIQDAHDEVQAARDLAAMKDEE